MTRLPIQGKHWRRGTLEVRRLYFTLITFSVLNFTRPDLPV